MQDRAHGGLERSLSLPVFTLYGVGTMVGAGFYALLGEVAERSGAATPLAFALAAVVGLLSAISFGELSTRMPVSAGEARYVREAFGRPFWAGLTGWAVIATGLVSAATLSVAFARFLRELGGPPETAAILGFVVVTTTVAALGVAHAARVAVAITLLEVGGLLVVLASAAPRVDAEGLTAVLGAGLGDGLAGAALGGAFLALYAFVGFEDMVNLAEEVREPERNLRRGLYAAFAITATLYVVVAVVALAAVGPETLAASRSPLAAVVGGHGGWLLTAIGLAAGCNGALMQIVMASRVAYGLGSGGAGVQAMPRALAVVHPRTRTPVRATLVGGAIVLALATSLPLDRLAEVTSAIILLVFTAVHASAWRLLGREGASLRRRVVPAVGGIASLGFLVGRLLF